MFLGPPRPLPSKLGLGDLLTHARPREPLGAWVSGCSPGQRIYRTRDTAASLLLSQDLGFLLTRCSRIVVRSGERPVLLKADTIIQWRALQVATATPYLPGLPRLHAMFPGLRVSTAGLLVPVGKESPEQVLAVCLEEGVRVSGSRIVYEGAETAVGGEAVSGGAVSEEAVEAVRAEGVDGDP
jgi:hypothetical protein